MHMALAKSTTRPAGVLPMAIHAASCMGQMPAGCVSCLTSQSCAGFAPPVHCALVLLHCRADHIWAESHIPSHLHCLNPSLVFSALQGPHCGQLPLR